MFRTRLISGIILLVIALITVINGGPLLFGTLLIISLIGMSELYRMLNVHNQLLGGVGYLGAIGYYVVVWFGNMEYVLPLTIALIIILMAVYVFSYPGYKAEQAILVFFGFFYVAVMLSYIFQTRNLEQGTFLVWLVFLCSWGCDTCAYCVGMLIGKHKMAPRLSPKKSVEGGIGGIVGAALLGALYAFCINQFADAGTNILHYALICAAGAVISQVGDLAASGIKRNHGIKDYGNLIPGHGGILDRFDSVIFTAPIIFYLAQALIR